MINLNANATSKLSTAQKAKMAVKGMSAEKIDETAKEFEAQFISQMLGNMFSGIDPENALGGGEAEGTYRSLLIDEYGKLISRAGGIGVADHVKREMLKMQEVES
jgi:Rod binding domain-containing protein